MLLGYIVVDVDTVVTLKAYRIIFLSLDDGKVN